MQFKFTKKGLDKIMEGGCEGGYISGFLEVKLRENRRLVDINLRDTCSGKILGSISDLPIGDSTSVTLVDFEVRTGIKIDGESSEKVRKAENTMGGNSVIEDLKIAKRMIEEGRVAEAVCRLDSIVDKGPVYSVDKAFYGKSMPEMIKEAERVKERVEWEAKVREALNLIEEEVQKSLREGNFKTGPVVTVSDEKLRFADEAVEEGRRFVEDMVRSCPEKEKLDNAKAWGKCGTPDAQPLADACKKVAAEYEKVADLPDLRSANHLNEALKEYREAKKVLNDLAADVEKAERDFKKSGPEPFWVVWSRYREGVDFDLDDIPSIPSVKHDTQEKAIAEAERLAVKHPEKEFHVLRSVSTASAGEVVTEFHKEVKDV